MKAYQAVLVFATVSISAAVVNQPLDEVQPRALDGVAGDGEALHPPSLTPTAAALPNKPNQLDAACIEIDCSNDTVIEDEIKKGRPRHRNHTSEGTSWADSHGTALFLSASCLGAVMANLV
jgi:hypothetical protein